MKQELVILVDEDNQPIGTAPKATVHHGDTPLHRAFSCFLFNPLGELLLQQRAASKVTWPKIWSNSVCGHPLPEEALIDAVRRRIRDELGLLASPELHLELLLPNYRYRAEYLGVVENEICPVWVGFARAEPRSNPEEVQALSWVPWRDFVRGVREQRDPFYQGLSPWCKEETLLLAESVVLEELFEAHGVDI